jgi:hypothetical protein
LRAQKLSCAILKRGTFVIHKGIQYNVMATADSDIWLWQFKIGDTVKTGKTETRLAALAARRVELKIDAVLRASRPGSSNQSGNFVES